jgi:diaminohydroxyphosphoribosylaminopyrimidine deaminase/5-amino-6-(5-phosphoribosylamino)uracil reductase
MREILEKFMLKALTHAKKGWGKTGHQPMAGCVIVEHGSIVAEAWSEDASGDSVIITALDVLGRGLDSSGNLFVTMEPIARVHSNGNEIEAIVDAKMQRVVYGCPHPDKDFRGAGLEALQLNGVNVLGGVLEEGCLDLNLIYNYWDENKKPLIATKLATTIDGKIATRAGESKWITGEQARQDVMKWRQLFPAIAIGAQTLIDDNPRLTVRLHDEEETSPLRLVFDGGLISVTEENMGLNLYSDAFKDRTIVVTVSQADPEKFKILDQNGIKYWPFQSHGGHAVPFEKFLRQCYEQDIAGVIFEGGANLISKLMSIEVIKYLFSYRSPTIFGDSETLAAFSGRECLKLEDAVRLSSVKQDIFGEDHLYRGYINYPAKPS